MNSEKKHVCHECGSAFNRPYRLAQHLLVHKNIKIFKCGENDCNKSYTSKSHLDRHIYSVHIEPDFNVINRCRDCMKVFSNRQNLKRHIKNKHAKKNSFICDVCKSDFKKKHLLTAHMYQHTFVKSFSCDYCNKEFVTLRDKKKHLKYHKTYNCDKCNMAFNHWSKYQKHRKIDHHSREFICNDCGRKFKQRRHIVHHIKTHMVIPNVKVYSCWFEGCDRFYSRQSNLKQHINIKHLEITHPCEICDAHLSTKAKLKAHLLTHSKPKIGRKRPKTKKTGRKVRKDDGTIRSATALKLSGLINVDTEVLPYSDIQEIKKEIEEIECDTVNSTKDNLTIVEADIEETINSITITFEPIGENNILEIPKIEKYEDNTKIISESSQAPSICIEDILNDIGRHSEVVKLTL